VKVNGYNRTQWKGVLIVVIRTKCIIILLTTMDRRTEYLNTPLECITEEANGHNNNGNNTCTNDLILTPMLNQLTQIYRTAHEASRPC
jgi:hypothetical protein